MKADISYSGKKCSAGIGSLLAGLCLLLLSSCQREEDPYREDPGAAGQCQATLVLNVSPFGGQDAGGTRSVAGTTDEDRIRDIWIFQYDAETGKSLKQPAYLDKFDSNDIQFSLTPNEAGAKSIVCIVANTHERRWAYDEYDNINVEIDTYSKLIEHQLPETVLDAFTSSHMGENGSTIPMFGESKAMAITNKCYVSIPLVRMFARVRVYTDPSFLSNLGMKLKGFTFCNIPYWCRIGSLAPAGGDSEAASYPSDVIWKNFPVEEGANEVILYIPENLQGKVSGMTSKQTAAASDIPANAFRVELDVLYDDNNEKSHTYTVYPGLDMVNDFNVKRNHLYNVNISITKLPE